jgi:ribosomal-protein-alanine N-acetyltransferase
VPGALSSPVIEPLGEDIVTVLQCVAIDADAFPYASEDLVLAPRDPGAIVWVAREEPGTRVVGFLTARAHGRVLHVNGIAVDRACRRAGIGRALLREAKRAARVAGARAIALVVAAGNVPAIALYENEGFDVVRPRPGFYSQAVPGGPDALEMRWDARAS